MFAITVAIVVSIATVVASVGTVQSVVNLSDTETGGTPSSRSPLKRSTQKHMSEPKHCTGQKNLVGMSSISSQHTVSSSANCAAQFPSMLVGMESNNATVVYKTK